MTLEFTVEQKENGMLLRDFLRKRGVSAALAKGVKASDGFFRDGAPVHTDMRLSAGQRISFALPPEPPTEVLPQALPLDILYEEYKRKSWGHPPVLFYPLWNKAVLFLPYRWSAVWP